VTYSSAGKGTHSIIGSYTEGEVSILSQKYIYSIKPRLREQCIWAPKPGKLFLGVRKHSCLL
jgi:hypothetical protein